MPDPALTDANVRHLLRRTEFVDRTSRVNHLLTLGSIAAAVDDVLAVPPTTPTMTFASAENWQRGVELTYFWLDQMAFDAPRPMRERMAFFWHGLFCSDLEKVGDASLMREQIDLWRAGGLGNVATLARTMSTQVAMLRYLDNNQNKASSPNQNFARELMELFLLGVGNYNEADVEASTAAWTGHSDQWNDTVAPYRWRREWHDPQPKSFLGVTINQVQTESAWPGHGPETIDVILGTGRVPADATNVANRGRPTREVAAEFLSRKLWTSFATDAPPTAAVMTAMRTALLDNNFAVRPWVTAMLTHPDFYADSVKNGLVRTPVEYTVALLTATGKRAGVVNAIWLMESMGQRPLFPPNVSGWRANGYWVNASAIEGRERTAQVVGWTASRNYWDPGGFMSLAGGNLTAAEITATTNRVPTLSPSAYITRLESLMDIRLTPTSKTELVAYATSATVWERYDALLLMMIVPEMHLA